MLTLSQRKTYEFVKQYFHHNHYAPTAAEVAQGIGIQSRGVVHRYLKALADKGYIRLTPNRHRNIQLLARDASSPSIPLMGAIAAGRPIEAVAQQEAIDVAQIFLGVNRYALRVKGDSMIDEGILDGDIVICEHACNAQDGQIAVVLIDHEQATLKKVYHNVDNTITLLPANSSHQPMVYAANRVEIQGIYIGLLRFK
jgi:repressor LexA